MHIGTLESRVGWLLRRVKVNRWLLAGEKPHRRHYLGEPLWLLLVGSRDPGARGSHRSEHGGWNRPGCRVIGSASRLLGMSHLDFWTGCRVIDARMGRGVTVTSRRIDRDVMSSVRRLTGVADHHCDDTRRGHVNHHGWCRRRVPLAVMTVVITVITAKGTFCWHQPWCMVGASRRFPWQ